MQNLNAWFDSEWYCQQYPDIAEAGVDPYRHYINHGIKEGRLPCQLQALEWDVALWQQFNSPAECLSALHTLLEKAQPLEASYAAFALGRWYGWKSEWAEAARVLALRPSEGPCLPNHFGADLLEIEACTRAGSEPIKTAVASVEEHLGETGRVLLRKSGTEPLIRVMVEAEDEQMASRCAREIADALG